MRYLKNGIHKTKNEEKRHEKSTNCGKELPDGSKFCDGCGAKRQEYLICPSCGAKNKSDHASCQSCGASVKKVAAPIQLTSASTKEKKRHKKSEYTQHNRNTGEIYYTTSRVEEHCLMDYIEDDTAEKDATIAMPETPNYPAEPTRSRYDSYNEYASAYNAWEREYNRPKDGYVAVREAYWGKLDRDGLRVGLKAVKIEQTKYSFRIF